MGLIRTQGAAVFRDNAIQGDPSSGPHKVVKAAVRTLMGTIEDAIAASALGMSGVNSWTELQEIADPAPNAVYVVSSADTGTHEDPVSGEIVDNAGFYRWNADEEAMEKLDIAALAAGGTDIACDIVAVGTTWTFTPQPGQTPVHPAGEGQTYSGRIPADTDGFSAVVEGINDTPAPDPRPASFQHADYATTGTLWQGEYVRIAFRENGTVQILDPSPAAGGGGSSTASAFLRLDLVDHVGNILHVEPPTGGHPNNTGDGYFGVLQVPEDYPPSESGWAIATSGITMDPIVLEYRDGSDIPGDAIVGGDVIFWSRPGGVGNYQLFQIWRPNDAMPGGSADTQTEYDRVMARWAAANAHAARLLGQRNAAALAEKQDAFANLTYFGGLAGAADKIAYFTGPTGMALADFTTQGRAVVAAASYAAMRTLLSLVPGTDVQVADATLTALAGVTTAANKGLYATGVDAFSTYDLTAGGRALGGVAGTADTFPYFSASNVVTLASSTSAGRSMMAAADAAAQRALLSLGTMAQQNAASVAITGGTAFGLSGLQVTGATSPSTGSGLEIQGGGSVIFQAYNRGTSAYIPFTLDASQVSLRPGGSVKLLANTTQVTISGSLKVPSYTVATVPSASTHGAGAEIYVSDMAGGAEFAFSDGTNWRRFSDRTTIS